MNRFPVPTATPTLRPVCLPVFLALLTMLSVVSLPSSAAERPARKAKGEGATKPLTVPDTVKVERDLVYAKYGSRELMLDLYLPKVPTNTPIPCIMVIHGGGWRSGDKQRFAKQAAYLADKGFAAACIGYRLMPEVQILDCIKDCKASVRWVRANAGKYGIDPDRIGAIGGSAGGHLVAALGTSYKAEKLEGEGGNAGISSRVQAVVAMAAVTDFNAFGSSKMTLDKETASLIAPVTYVDKDSAPILLLHGDADKLVPLQQSELLATKYKAAGAAAETFVFKGGPHGFWNTGSTFDETMEKATTFFRKVLTK